MVMARSFVALTSLLCFCITASTVQAAPNVCAKPQEYEALNMRALQSELMVAALSCSQSRQYNWFVKKYEPQLASYTLSMKGFFARHGSARPDKTMNDLVTHMANRASRSSLSRPANQYCGQVNVIYKALQNNQFNKVRSLANKYYNGWHRVPAC